MVKKTSMSRLILLLGTLAWSLVAQGQPVAYNLQQSSVDELANVTGRNVIVRNYDNRYEVIAYVDGTAPEQNVVTDMATTSTSFLIRDMQSGQVKLLGTLPQGYVVSDVRFVRLGKRNPTTDSADFCCFCGTHYGEIVAEVQPWGKADGEENIQYGFAGFFSMAEAMAPQPTHSIKLRRVEHAYRLDRMVGYGEQKGMYYPNVGNPYIDNAVLDIVGEPEANFGTASCLWRVKFYPECTSGTRWDNSLRYSNDPTEVLVDIAKTENHIVTLSRFADKQTIWVRHGQQETNSLGGQLNIASHYFVGDINNIVMHDAPLPQNSMTRYEGDMRLVLLGRDIYTTASGDTCRGSYLAMSFRTISHRDDIDDIKGISTFLLRCDEETGGIFPICRERGGESETRDWYGLYDKGDFQLKDLTFLGVNQSLAILSRDLFFDYDRMVLFDWPAVGNGTSCIKFISPDYTFHSLDHTTNSADRILAGGILPHSPHLLTFLSQRHMSAPSDLSCLDNETWTLLPISVPYTVREVEFIIRDKFKDTYRTLLIPFEPEIIRANNKCNKTIPIIHQ